jgi:adenylate cyclase
MPPPAAARPFQVSLTIAILTAFSLVFLTVMGFTALATYQFTIRTALRSATKEMADLTALTASRTTALIEPLTTVLAVTPALPAVPDSAASAEAGATESAFRNLLAGLPQAHGVFAMRFDGAQVEMANISAMSAARRAALAPPAGATLAVRIQDALGGGGGATWRFLDRTGRVMQERHVAGAENARDEVNFRTAMNADGVATTVLHALPMLGAPGIGVVRAMPGGGVFGFDLTLDSLSGFLAAQRVSRRSSAFIIDDNGILMAHSNPALSMNTNSLGEAMGWMTIASSKDPLLKAIWNSFAIAKLAPGKDIALKVDREDYLVRMASLEHFGSPPSLVVVAAPVADFTGPVKRARDRTLALFLIAGAIGLALIALVARQINRPLAALTREADRIGRFELDHPLAVVSRLTEVAALARTMEAMKSALHIFGLYVPKDLVRQLVSTGAKPRLGGERRDLTVMFTDIVGFTTIADETDAEELMRLTSAYFERMTQEVMGAGGTIDKYIGDAVMALWNAPTPDPVHADHACLAALRCRDLSSRLAVEFSRQGWPPLHTRFGVNTGEAVVGNVGSSDRISYTAIGADVNLASRLEGLCKQYGSHILAGEATRVKAGPQFVFRRVDRVLPKGRRSPTDIHELLGLRAAADPTDSSLVLEAADIAWAKAWDEIVSAYLDRRFADARAGLNAANLGRRDPLADLYAHRLAAYLAEPPPADWNGVAAYQEK